MNTVEKLEAVSGMNERIIEPTVEVVTPSTEEIASVKADLASTETKPETAESVLTEIAHEVIAEAEAVVQAVETEAVQVEQAVVAEVETVVAYVETEVKEGYVAAENLARKILNHHISAGGGSVIKNPA